MAPGFRKIFRRISAGVLGFARERLYKSVRIIFLLVAPGQRSSCVPGLRTASSAIPRSLEVARVSENSRRDWNRSPARQQECTVAHARADDAVHESLWRPGFSASQRWQSVRGLIRLRKLRIVLASRASFLPRRCSPSRSMTRRSDCNNQCSSREPGAGCLRPDRAHRPNPRPRKPTAEPTNGSARKPSAAVEDLDCMIPQYPTAKATIKKARLVPMPRGLLLNARMPSTSR